MLDPFPFAGERDVDQPVDGFLNHHPHELDRELRD